VKDALVKYLGLHAYGRPWLGRFRDAASRYIHDRSDVTILGVLVRDGEPNSLDCSGRANSDELQRAMEVAEIRLVRSTLGSQIEIRAVDDQQDKQDTDLLERVAIAYELGGWPGLSRECINRGCPILSRFLRKGG
jgi:hypothetical protein